jgi:hypothetical protein
LGPRINLEGGMEISSLDVFLIGIIKASLALMGKEG